MIIQLARAAGSGLLLGAALLCGCARQPETVEVRPAVFDPAAFGADRAFSELEQFLSLGLRDSGTPGAERAANHLRARLVNAGVEARVDAFEDRTPRGTATFRNVIGRLPGRGRGLIILGSHYDTMSGMPEGFQGANDSGSSTAVLLELARMMARGPEVGPEIWFVFFDGEEAMAGYGPYDGLHGSRRMAAALVGEKKDSSVLAVIILDMIGDTNLTVTIPRNTTPWLVNTAFDAAREEGVRSRFSLYAYEVGDDHDPFFSAGMPAVNLIDFHYGSAPGLNDYWHTAQDTLDKISAESLGIVGRVTVRIVNRIIAPAP